MCSGGGGGPLDKGSPPNNGDNSTSSTSLSIDFIKTLKKSQKGVSGVVDLLEVIASQGLDGKNKEMQFLEYKDRMIMNSKT